MEGIQGFNHVQLDKKQGDPTNWVIPSCHLKLLLEVVGSSPVATPHYFFFFSLLPQSRRLGPMSAPTQGEEAPA